MTNKNMTNKKTASIIINIGVALLEIAALILTICTHGAGLLTYYTNDSNIFALFACAILAGYQIREAKSGKAVPNWALWLKYTAACLLTVTFLVVACMLAPMNGAQGYVMMMFSGSLFLQHFFCPLVVLFSFIFLEPAPQFTMKDTWYALIPTGVYAVILVILNLVRKVTGPYPFLKVYDQPVWASILWIIVIGGAAFLVAWGVRAANAKRAKRLAAHQQTPQEK